MSNPFRWETAAKLITRDNDPKQYGMICPCCNKRYGNPERLGFIDVRRCGNCPSLAMQDQMYFNKRFKELKNVRRPNG